jgi:Family of unknown function (DUF6502)
MANPSADRQDPDAALPAALARLLAPLAQLAVARGVPFSVLDGLLRAAVVRTAHASHPGLPEHRRASRVSAATGLNRREVNRLLALQAADESSGNSAPPRSPAAMVFAHWRSTAAYRTRAGAPRVLPRTGPAPSFESLAQEVTRDVHPRALLEELLRLNFVAHDSGRDTVTLLQANFVPRGDDERMLQWLAANVGDHLAGAVANVAGRTPAHADQAIAADGLSAESIAKVRPLLHAQWLRLSEELVPLLEALIEEDAARVGPANPTHSRVCFGLYGFDTTPMQPARHDRTQATNQATTHATTAAARQKTRKASKP